ncbi:MAG: MBL fold metallo-hydrolase [Betaproteobacteria bacterium]|nr:MBL fold metallo-hydrolase [Betaproteobacteria bacterium]
MNLLEAQLHYPWDTTLPEIGRRLDLTADLAWLRMPLPFALDHINLWLLRDCIEGQEGWTLVDCGASTDAIREAWEQLIAAAPGQQGLDGLPIVRIICTHMHPDHLGLAAMLAKRFACSLWMTVGEYGLCRVLSQALPGADGESAFEHYRSHGVMDAEKLAQLRKHGAFSFRSLVPEVPSRFRRIRDGEVLRIGNRNWQVITGSGHSPEHASLYSESLAFEGETLSQALAHPQSDRLMGQPILISGDMVLPRISTNTSVWEIEPESNPVQWFVEGISRFRRCKAETLVLPSHGKPFEGLHTRIEQLRNHHAERLDEVRRACEQADCSAMDIVPVMFRRPLDTHQISFALGEALGHLHALWYAGELTRYRDQQQVFRFRPSSGSVSRASVAGEAQAAQSQPALSEAGKAQGTQGTQGTQRTYC